MRSPAQRAASRANGARSRGPRPTPSPPCALMDARSLKLLTRATVLKNESREGFHQLVRQHLLHISPRNAVELAAVEEICSATWRLHRLRALERKTIDLELAAHDSPDNLECLVLASSALAGRNRHFHLFLQRHETRLQSIIRRSLARIRALRQLDEKKDSSISHPSC